MNLVTVRGPLGSPQDTEHAHKGFPLFKQPSLKKTKKNSVHYHLTCFNVSSQMVKNTKVQTRNNHNVVANIINMEL